MTKRKQTLTVPHNWSPRSYQEELWANLCSGVKRSVMVWHRRSGKDYMCMAWTAREMMRRVGIYWHVYPYYSQGKKALWDGKTNDGKSYLSIFPEELIDKKWDVELKIRLKNGSIWQIVGEDNSENLLGSNPVGAVFSEFAYQKSRVWDHIVEPIMLANEGWAIFNSTPLGEANYFYKLAEYAKKDKQWYFDLKTIDDTKDEKGNPIIDKAYIDKLRDRGVDEAIIQQEYYCSFKSPIVGAYYRDQLIKAEEDKRITNVPYDPLLEVGTAWDIGIKDYTAVWFFQVYNYEVRIIDYYEKNNASLTDHLKFIKEKGYVYDVHHGPHDLAARELTTGKSRASTARGLGVNFHIVPKGAFMDGIESVRALFPRMWIDKEKCKLGLAHLKNYTRKWDSTNGVFLQVQKHDKTSHAADALRTMSMGMRRGVSRVEMSQQGQDYAIDTWC